MLEFLKWKIAGFGSVNTDVTLLMNEEQSNPYRPPKEAIPSGATPHRMPKYAISIAIAVTGAFACSDYTSILLHGGVDNLYENEMRRILFASMSVAVVSATVAARRAQTFSQLALLLILFHILWVHPIWGFHHDYTLGCFAWLLLGGDDGFSIFPTVIGLPLTIMATIFSLRLFPKTNNQDAASKFPPGTTNDR